MHTQTHALIGAYCFGRRNPALVAAGAVGGVAPDLPMFAIVAALMAAGRPGRQIFGHDYFEPWWQATNGLSHSFILWSLMLVTGLAARRADPAKSWPALCIAFAAGGLAHAFVDFLCHRDDAHMHFWPISSWRFVSPVSYYDPAHFGRPAMIVEALLGLGMAVRLGLRAQRRWPRALLALVSLPYLVVLALVPARAEAPGGVGDVVPLGRFESGSAGWSTVAIDKKVPQTRYMLARNGNMTVVEARADRSQALFVRNVDIALDQTPILCWRWRVVQVIEGADIRTKQGDDQAARVLVGLSLPRGSLSLGTRIKLAVGRARFGKLLPDGALNYVWDNKAPVGTIVPNAFTDRARMIVVQSGNARAGAWVSERRDLAADMKSQFGTMTGRMALIALATDADNTGGMAQASYADLHLVRRGAPCQFQT